MKLTGENRSTRGKSCPTATLFTTNPTWTDPGLRGTSDVGTLISVMADQIESGTF
jgi:hypothetical protein